MTVVVTFENVVPVARYDSVAWEEARIEEAATADGTYAVIDTITLDPVEVDPADPLVRNLTTPNGTAVDLWYTITFIDGNGDESTPSDPIQNTSQAGTAYATVDELARILKIRTPTAAQTVALQRVLLAAALEINREIDLADDADPLSGAELALAEEVNLERAAELWRLQEVQFGLVGLGTELPTHIARDTWARYAIVLAPLKGQWGFA